MTNYLLKVIKQVRYSLNKQANKMIMMLTKVNKIVLTTIVKYYL